MMNTATALAPSGNRTNDNHGNKARYQTVLVQGDAMAPKLRSGDYVAVDLSDQIPSPEGMFAISDPDAPNGPAIYICSIRRRNEDREPHLILTPANSAYEETAIPLGHSKEMRDATLHSLVMGRVAYTLHKVA